MIRREKILIFMALAASLLLSFVIYGGNRNDFFVSDDFDWVHLTAARDSSFVDYFTGNYYGIQGEGGSYRPMVNVWMHINYAIGGLSSVSYHSINIVLHGLVIFMVGLLTHLLFKEKIYSRMIAVFAAVLFAILPSHAEAVNWIAAVADPASTFFVLLSTYWYIRYRQGGRLRHIISALIAFVVALLHKETVLTIPLVLVLWEVVQYVKTRKLHKQSFWLLGYIGSIAVYFLVRWKALGLVFGYYARDTFAVKVSNIFATSVDIPLNLFLYNDHRIAAAQFLYQYWWLYIVLIILIIILLLKKKAYVIFTLLIAYGLLLAPTLLVMMNRLNDEGERYGYLPSVVACIIFALLITKLLQWEVLRYKRRPFICIAVFAVIGFYCGSWLQIKNDSWKKAANISQAIIQDFNTIVDLDAKGEGVLFVGLPDTYNGAQVLRNGIKQAIALYYPEYQLDAILLPVYVRLTDQNVDQQIFNWVEDDRGVFAATTDGKYWVTGIDRRESDELIFELWGYDYSTYSSPVIRLIYSEEFKKQLEQKKIYILSYDNSMLIDRN